MPLLGRLDWCRHPKPFLRRPEIREQLFYVCLLILIQLQRSWAEISVTQIHFRNLDKSPADCSQLGVSEAHTLVVLRLGGTSCLKPSFLGELIAQMANAVQTLDRELRIEL